ncbi:MAG: trehalose-phosphatase [Nitrospirae bacterium CG_4_10_14_0_8_um_filter_41_23]|nr:trehalose-phosphatase [Nitrospirota bacterium]OIP60751.1 MAG: trehalose-phosphatase [Nitrospirae bacterium CG2_30_41_42]PIQ94398.1 MAG: trehalose-phosphatase [Nitrospirae bacterium CG11_big_fil_rev_8_21_14_0_20_41_14]PIV41789.1 MAG: trehalose-phosphatase [Nitrospirae bacterium CG02_land_8_20_14_3_00_41_53]PIW88279.1 MAG: trehalose-phosphatase [Nitrospirae bacterium CG_4_8_14_3_um_filter_41_47]PIY86348.1 MAG: trehalose-phosphatase [Nitrospirae bacterium CG_4_10_14_0_8_um_filter_41_23]PJA792
MPPVYLFKCKNLSDLIKPDQKIALFLDFDGTLVPIQKDPAQCFLMPEIKKQLRSLANSEGCYVSILSGRKLSDIRKRIGIPCIYYGGNHGIDIAGPGMRYTHPKASSTRPTILKIKHLLEKEIVDIKGTWLEDKKFTLTLHFRAVKKGDISSVKKAFYKTVARFIEETNILHSNTKGRKNNPPIPPLVKGGKGGFSNKKLLIVIKGKKVLELVPNISWDKGKAALLILKAIKDKCFPVYVGDDQTDENAFSVLSEEGITIRVGKSMKTLAKFYVKSYREVPQALDMLTITAQSEGIYEKKSF